MLIFDGHLDLAMNAVEWNRDLTQPLDDVRPQVEAAIRNQQAETLMASKADEMLAAIFGARTHRIDDLRRPPGDPCSSPGS